MTEFPKLSAWGQEDERRKALEEAATRGAEIRSESRARTLERIASQPVDGQVITNRLKEAALKQARVTEYEIMEMQGELSTAVHALDAGDFRSAKSMIQRVIDDLRFLL